MIRTQLYADMVFLIKDMGIIVVGIKRSVKKKMARFKQCERINDFVSLVFDGFTLNKNPLLVVKVVIIGELQIVNAYHT